MLHGFSRGQAPANKLIREHPYFSFTKSWFLYHLNLCGVNEFSINLVGFPEDYRSGAKTLVDGG